MRTRDMNLTHRSKGTVLVIDDRPEHMQVLIAALTNLWRDDCGGLARRTCA